ncbi:MAG: hypothetical protein K8S94_02500 [Planctomycetia bacterium]|nr:hypothetical protein [Planctomycetia bacterium]
MLRGRMRLFAGVIASVACAGLSFEARGQLRIVEQVSLTGTVESVAGSRVTVRDVAGTRHEVRVQKPDEQGVPLADGRLLAFPAEVQVGGAIDAAKLKPGQIVRFKARLSGKGTVDGDVGEVTLIDAAAATVGVVWDGTEPTTPKEVTACDVTAPVSKALKTRLVVELPAGQPFKKKTLVAVKLADGAKARLLSTDLKRIEPGATVVRLEAAKLDSGDLVAKTLVVENGAAAAVADRGDDALENKYRSLSDLPLKEPRLVRSPHFAFLTDLSDREWAVIRDKLERMVGLLEKYFGRQSTGVVEGFIVDDLAVWPAGTLKEPMGIEKIRRREGVCFNSSLGPQRRAELYSCADHGVIQHECVHGFCHLTFGSTGPTWLAEGVAELGNYWRDGDTAVEIEPAVMGYIRITSPKRSLGEIAVPGREPAGGWQDYAWRWALCHLLAYNPNYADRFKPLAVALMEERPGASFDAVYGPVAREIAFEYDRFLEAVGNGYRADLTAWPWKAKFRPLAVGADAKVKVAAARGWQAGGIIVEQGATYDVEAAGTWRTAKAAADGGADGDGAGHGRLVATIFHDFALTTPIPLAARSSFTAPVDGQLFLRCDDDWTQLADNEGELTVTVRRP